MANKISDETIEYVGILAKLELSDEEKEQAKKDMETMLDYIDTLNELDTEGIEPMSHVFPVNNVFREDVVTNGDNHEAMLANAPQQKEQNIRIGGNRKMDLKGLTAVELGKKIQAKEVTVKEAVEACFAQIDRVEKEVNSFVSLQKEAALKRAEEVQKLMTEH